MQTSTPLRVTLVTKYFYPDVAADGQLLTELAVDLARMGCEIRVYAAQPIYAARRRVPSFEIHQGVEVHRLPSSQLNKNSRIGRIVNSLTFFFSSLFALLRRPPPGPLFLVSNPPFLGLLGVLLHRLRGQRYIYLVEDLYPDIAVTLGYLRPDGWIRKLWDRANRLVLSHASRIVVLGETMRDRIADRLPRDRNGVDRIRVIHNWADENFIRPLSKSENPFAREQALVDAFVVLYSGNLGLSQDLETVIAAAERLQGRNLVFLFIGDGGKKPRLTSMVAERGLGNVRFLPYQPREAVPYSVTCADVSLVALERGIEGLSMPSKLYTILASGRPVLALVESGGEMARLIDRAECGTSVDPRDVAGLVRALDFYAANPDACVRQGENGRRYLETHFSRERASREYFEVLQSCGASGGGH